MIDSPIVFPAKIGSEALLSFYPTFVKKIDLGIDIQLAGRLFTYGFVALIISLFTNIKWTAVSMPTFILLTFVNIIHIFFSYFGFEYLPSGIAYTLFYTFPVMIAAVSGNFSLLATIITLSGVYMIAKEDNSNSNSKTINNWAVGAIIMAAITEVVIYLIVRKIKVDNPWHLTFFTYIGGAILSLIYLFWKRKELLSNNNTFKNENENDVEDNLGLPIKKKKNVFLLMLLLNGIIGAVGYTLRFYSSQMMSPLWFAILSYLGIIFAFVYGRIFNNEDINKWDILGTLLIIVGGLLLKLY